MPVGIVPETVVPSTSACVPGEPVCSEIGTIPVALVEGISPAPVVAEVSPELTELDGTSD